MGVQKLRIGNDQSPGDVLMLTAAIRDLHLSHPGRFKTAVETPFPQIWENNPYVSTFGTGEDGIQKRGQG